MEELLQAWFRLHVKLSKAELREQQVEHIKEHKTLKGFNGTAWLEQRIRSPRYFIFVPSLGICPKDWQ